MQKKRNKLMIIINSFLILLLSVGLAACTKRHKTVFVPPVPKLTLKQIRHHYVDLMERNKLQVIHVGEDIRIILLDDYLFQPDSANIRPTYDLALQTAAKFMLTYDKVSVKVSAYLDNRSSYKFSQALSTRQAQVVANALWSHGIDTRLIYAVGYNRLNPVGWNGGGLRKYNRRVEVSFRYLPKHKSYN